MSPSLSSSATSAPHLRIAVFHLGFFYSGGGEKLVLEELRGLRALGHEVTVFAPYVDRPGCFPDYPEIREVKSLLPPPPRWLPMHGPIWVTLSCLLIPLLARRFRGFDVLFGANQPGPWLAFVVSRILGRPYVIYLAQALRILHPREVDRANGIRIREGDTRYINFITRVGGWLIDRLDRLSVRHASIVLTNGDHVSQWIREVYGCENTSCPAGCHPVPATHLDYAARFEGSLCVGEQRIPKPYVLLTNRHSPMKRFEYALWAIKSVRRHRPEARLVITGQETEYTDQLRYLALSLGLGDAVHFVGLVPEADLARLYREAAVYVYPSPEEDFGMGIVEAMAAGTPVVAWASGGPTVTVRDGETGFLAPVGDTAAFAAAIDRLLVDPPLAERLGRAGLRRASELFSYSRHALLLEQALMRALRVPSPGGELLSPTASWVRE